MSCPSALSPPSTPILPPCSVVTLAAWPTIHTYTLTAPAFHPFWSTRFEHLSGFTALALVAIPLSAYLGSLLLSLPLPGHSLGCLAHRPYLYSSYALAAVCFPYVLVKALLYRYGTNTDAIAAAAIFGIVGAFAWFHVLAARWVGAWVVEWVKVYAAW